MPILKNQKHEKFAQLVAKGESGKSAYKQVYGVNGKVGEAASSRLLRDVKVYGRVAELQTRAADSSVMDIKEMRQFFAKVKRVTESNATEEEMAEVVTTAYTEDGRPYTILPNIPAKIRAIEADAKLAGYMRDTPIIGLTLNQLVMSNDATRELSILRKLSEYDGKPPQELLDQLAQLRGQTDSYALPIGNSEDGQ